MKFALVAALMLIGLPLIASRTPAEAQENDSELIDRLTPTEIEQKVAGLTSDSYLRRKRATAELVQIGPPAVDALVTLLESGDLESTERVIGILQEIASQTSVMPKVVPVDGSVEENDSNRRPDLAWEELMRISTLGGSQGARAKLATKEVREIRRGKAVEILREQGIFVGVSDFIIGAREMPKNMVEVDEGFAGDIELVNLLRWVDGIEFARIKGEAIRAEVLAGIIQMPDLKTLTLTEGNLDLPSMKTLGGIPELRHLELRYIPMTGKLIDQLATVPIRVSLTLNGTAAPIERVDALRKTVPGLDIELKGGGFLGVRSIDNFNECSISQVIAGGAAEQAGLTPGDVITEADGKPVRQFKDLQEAINAHMPGDTIEINYRRDDTEMTTKATLGKMKDS